jgi:hypothetical protein
MHDIYFAGQTIGPPVTAYEAEALKVPRYIAWRDTQYVPQPASVAHFLCNHEYGFDDSESEQSEVDRSTELIIMFVY